MSHKTGTVVAASKTGRINGLSAWATTGLILRVVVIRGRGQPALISSALLMLMWRKTSINFTEVHSKCYTAGEGCLKS